MNTPSSIMECSKAVPVAAEVDVVVVGGTTYGVSAALAARAAGASVYLIAPKMYLGEDMCATLRLSLENGQRPETELARNIFAGGTTTTPLRVKKVLDKALLDAGVQFLFGCIATDLLKTAEGEFCGVVTANRAGRQGILARMIIDATDRAAVARLAGAQAQPWPQQPVEFQRTVIVPDESGNPKSLTHTIALTLADGSYRSLAAAEQQARDRTYANGQLRSAESLFFVPPDPIVCQSTPDQWKSPENADIGHFRPAGIKRLYVVSGCAAIPREAAADLLRPTALTAIAERVGFAAAEEAAAINVIQPQKPSACDTTDSSLEVREHLGGIRPMMGPPEKTVDTEPCALDVLGRYDVVVAGGGTAGAAAAIAAAREGKRVLVIEYHEALGGMGTVGMITKPYHGLKIGFAADVPFLSETENLEHKMEWLRREFRKAGGEIWLGCICAGAVVEGSSVRGVVVATPEQRGVVLADVTIDATGNAEAAIAAGAGFMCGSTDDGDIAMQGVGLPTRPINKDYVNTDYILADDMDMIDSWFSLVGSRIAMDDTIFDSGSMIQTRERRRIVGDYVLTYLDQIIGRTFSDSIVISSSDYDTHSYPSDIFFALIPHDEETRTRHHPPPGGICYTPYRSLLPRGFDGMLVIGLGMSMKRDASPLVRMQYDLLNQGYAAGLAAAMAVDGKFALRDIDIRKLQRRLVDMGALPAEVLNHADNLPLDATAIADAVRGAVRTGQPTGGVLQGNFVHNELPAEMKELWLKRTEKLRNPEYDSACHALAVVLAHRDVSLPEVRKSFTSARGDARLAYARMLCMMGEPAGVDELIEAMRAAAWDKKIMQGGMAEYGHLPTSVDSLVLALGWSGDLRAVPAILEKLDQLDADVTLSHHRAVALALERLADKSAAEPLARLLAKPGMSGYATTGVEPLIDFPMEKRRREGALREIVLARALLRCGDHNGVGRKILENYTRDMRGLFARHARMVLESGGRRKA